MQAACARVTHKWPPRLAVSVRLNKLSGGKNLYSPTVTSVVTGEPEEEPERQGSLGVVPAAVNLRKQKMVTAITVSFLQR